MTLGQVLAQLRASPLTVLARMPGASNLTLLARTAGGIDCIYKPISGERELWDFPGGTLAHRETAMYVLAGALGWDLIPPTVLRADGPFGPGMCQVFVPAVPDGAVRIVPAGTVAAGWRVAASGNGELLLHRDDQTMRRITLLDVIAANADRKGGHVLSEADGRVWGIDHGLTFAEQDKLRTVLWGFAGDVLGRAEGADLARLRECWGRTAGELTPLLAHAEVAAARVRLDRLLAERRYPLPEPGWPRLPWPVI